ncbi:Integrase family protein [Thiomonas sp. X19]|uniref:tyrosine-type recombinase/integrase n=1 Tax=Thiomonas sp. X19 TaxID=1050370 RepID=UPI000B73297E|nr:site-specific integrase [Thiomonas sp. X19]SCC95086.1 Integrase family protein [Thiomonas sp. X19]
MPSISRTFDLKADAEAWAREIEREAQRGNVGALRDDAGRTTLEHVASVYVAGPVQLLASRADVTRYMHAARARFGSFFLSAIRGVDVAAWRDELLKGGLSSQSVIHHLNALSGLFSFIEKELSIDLPSGNPVAKVRKPAMPKSRERRLRPGELDALMREARTPGLPQIIILAVETSMRLGELLGLEWKRVDLVKRTAHLVDTKNRESRTVALSSAASVALKSLHALPRRIDGRVFGWAASDSFEKAWVRCKARALAAYLADCAASNTKPDPSFLADLRFHDLRHEATSRLFERGLGVMEVASMTGHKSLAMLKRYTHVEAEKLAAKLG